MKTIYSICILVLSQLGSYKKPTILRKFRYLQRTFSDCIKWAIHKQSTYQYISDVIISYNFNNLYTFQNILISVTMI